MIFEAQVGEGHLSNNLPEGNVGGECVRHSNRMRNSSTWGLWLKSNADIDAGVIHISGKLDEMETGQ